MSQFILVWYLSYLLYVAASAQTHQTYHSATCTIECADSPEPTDQTALTQYLTYTIRKQCIFSFFESLYILRQKSDLFTSTCIRILRNISYFRDETIR